MLRKTTHYDICYTCGIIDYNHTESNFAFFTAPALGFIALNSINDSLLTKSLNLDSISSNIEYFLERNDFFPSHIFEIRDQKIKSKYFYELQKIFASPSNESKLNLNNKYNDIISSALTEIKYILYDLYGRAEAINPLTQGIFQKEFINCHSLIIKSLPNLNKRFRNMHYCDSCNIIGERIIMLDGAKIHPYDGCIWCI